MIRGEGKRQEEERKSEEGSADVLLGMAELTLLRQNHKL